jgi:lambda family phage portal protein
MNFATMQSVVANSLFESGEVLALRRTRDDVNATLPLAVEILEIDHLDSTVQSNGENEVIDGIEYDHVSGIVVAYWIFEQHPGSASRKRNMKSKRVPAGDVLHIRRIDRPGQMRGVPWLAPVMLTLTEMRDYQEAQILKQKISALLAGVVESGDEGVPEGASGLDALAPGALVYTEAGQKVTFTNPPKVDDYDVVMRLGLWAVAMGIGITGESLSGDLSRVNFSSMRGGRLEMDKNIETWQEQILIAQFCAGVGRWALDAYRLRASKRVGPLQMAWTAQRRALIDPTKEIPAIIKKVEAGLSSLSREQRAMGLDPETIARERAEDAARQPAAPDEPKADIETKKGKSA